MTVCCRMVFVVLAVLAVCWPSERAALWAQAPAVSKDAAAGALTLRRAMRAERETQVLVQLAKKSLPEGVRLHVAGGLRRELASQPIKAPVDVAALTQGKAALKAVVDAHTPVIPDGFIAAYEKTHDDEQGVYWRVRLVEAKAILTQADVQSARRGTNAQMGYPEVQVTLTATGKARFAAATQAKPGVMEHGVDRVAIMLGDELTSSPVVHEQISGGQLVVSVGMGGLDANADVDELVQTLNSK